jgi:aspartate dehydrogenase
MLHVTMVGYGAIGSELMRLLAGHNKVCIDQVITSVKGLAKAQAALGASVTVVSCLADLPKRPEVLIECAGHSALLAHVVPALADGVDCIVASIGALADDRLAERLSDAAQTGGSRLQLISGAIGALDALAAAQLGGLEKVVYVGRKPPLSWLGTPGESVVELARLTSAATLFEGSARDAARLYPKNANVAASLALAGMGLDSTQVRLVADPAVQQNVHSFTANGQFGQMTFTVEGRALANNPKTSALTAYSMARAVLNRVEPMGF